jgi:hypothetical protein
MLLGTVYVVILAVLAFRKYSGDIPMASSCSASISAACHPHPDDNEVYLFPLQWGVVFDREGIGHCSLTTDREATSPKDGERYA